MAGQENWEVVTHHFCTLGEGPVWDNDQQAILWVDILENEIHKFSLEEQFHTTLKVDQMVGAIAIRSSGGLIAALQHGFAAINWSTQQIEIINDPEAHLPKNRFNDGKCDPAGRFWAGSMSMNDNTKKGSLYMLNTDLSVAPKLSGVSCSNGLTWSVDQQIFYFIDTPTKQVVAYDYDVLNGQIANKRVIIETNQVAGYPDGMTIDTEGMLWIAMWDGYQVARFNPKTGKLIQCIQLPVSRVTSCAFGGPEMQDLYITSARNERAKEPLAGSLFVVKNSGFTGFPANEFKG